MKQSKDRFWSQCVVALLAAMFVMIISLLIGIPQWVFNVILGVVLCIAFPFTRKLLRSLLLIPVVVARTCWRCGPAWPLMKHVAVWTLAVAVGLVVSIFTKGFWPFIAGVVALTLIYHLASFLKYSKSTPKERLAFHEGAHFTSWSLMEIKSMLGDMVRGGLLKAFNDQRFFCSVSREKWQELTDSEKLTFCRLCFQSCIKIRGIDNSIDLMSCFSVEAYTPDFATSTDIELLNVYVPNKGLLTPKEFYDMPPFT